MAEPGTLSWREATETEILEGNAGENRTATVAWYDHMGDVDVDPEKLQIEEGMVAEVMKQLEEEINRPCGGGGGGGGGGGAPWFHDHQRQQLVPSSSTSSSSSSLAASAFVTVNRNDESCGPSFSDAASTVMANIDTRGVPRQPIQAAAVDEMEEFWRWFLEPAAEAPAAPALGEPAAAGSGGGITEEGFAVEDTEGSDDEWLARVLSGAGFELEAQR